MSSRPELISQMNNATTICLKEKGYLSFVDVLMGMGKLSKSEYENWRFRKVPYLEQVIRMNLAQLNVLLRTFHKNCKNGGLCESTTAYFSWGKGKTVPLRFSKTGDKNLEKAYSTHFLRPKVKIDKPNTKGEK